MKKENQLLWITPTKFGIDLCQSTQIGAANALADRGWKVHFISMMGNKEKAPSSLERFDLTEIPIQSKIFGEGIQFNRILSKELPNIISKSMPDIALVEWRGTLGFIKANKKIRIPWILEDRSPPTHDSIKGRLQWLHYNRSWKKGIKRCDGWSVITESLSNFVKQRFKIESSPNAIWPSGVDVERFLTSTRGTQRIVYHGRLDKERDIISIIEAVECLISSYPKIEVIIFGQGNDFSRLHSLSKKHSWFTLLGPQSSDNVPSLLQSSSIGVIPLPNRIEWALSSPLKLFEYVASGLDVVATNIPAHQNFSQFPWMHTYDSEDRIQGLVEALKQIIDSESTSSPELTKRDAQELFTWESATLPLHNALLEVIKSSY